MARRLPSDAQLFETDVLLIGGGGTGEAAALSAAEAGAQVIVAEKCNVLGGKSGLALGSITACCTS